MTRTVPPLLLYVMPHLPCRHNELKLVTGRVQDGVTERGRSLAPFIRARLPGQPPVAAIVTSSLPRATETVSLCFDGIGIPVIRDDRLTAIDYGDFHERPIHEVRPVRDRFLEIPFPHGESYAAMALRYRELLEDLHARFASRAVLLIGHDATLSMLHHLCEGRPLGEALGMREFEGRSDPVSFYTEWFGPFPFRPSRV